MIAVRSLFVFTDTNYTFFSVPPMETMNLKYFKTTQNIARGRILDSTVDFVAYGDTFCLNIWLIILVAFGATYLKH